MRRQRAREAGAPEARLFAALATRGAGGQSRPLLIGVPNRPRPTSCHGTGNYCSRMREANQVARRGTTTPGGQPLRARLAVAAVALLAGTLGIRLQYGAPWWLGGLLGLTGAAFYALPPEQPWGRAGMAASAALFTGVVSLAIIDLRAWSLLAAAIGGASFLAYCALVEWRTASVWQPASPPPA